MKEIFKAYHLFIPGNFKVFKMILLYIVAPLTMLGLCMLGVKDESGVLLVTVLCLLFSIEIFIDLGIFSGIQRTVSRQTVYLRISNKGMNLLKKALCGDVLRRLFVSVLPVLVAIIVSGKGIMISPVKALWIAALCFAIQELIMFITRFFDSLYINLIIGSAFIGGTTALIPLLIAGLEGERNTTIRWQDIVLLLCFAILAFLISFTRIRVTASRAREGYYE